jgi:hypothetical protein
MAKSYAQVKGQQVVDWKKELQLVIEGKESKVDFKLAGDWKTCHVGQQSEMIERDDDNVIEFSNGYATQDAQYCNRFKTIPHLYRYFLKEFIYV